MTSNRHWLPALLIAPLLLILLAGCGEHGHQNNGDHDAGSNAGSVFPACYDAGKRKSRSVAGHRCTWPAFALKLQRRLGRNEPLVDNLILATHNSFNVQGRDGFSSKLDPNQYISMADQLRLSMRGLEIDVHWIESNPSGKFKPLMCHGTSAHVPCTGDEPSLKVGLREIRDWLYAHPDRFVMLDIQDEFDGKSAAYEAAARTLKSVLGDLIYKPAKGGCSPIPLKTTPAQILASGAQVLVTSHCGPSGTNWPSLVFSVSNRVQRNNLVSDPFTPYPGCGNPFFTESDYQDRWTRLWEDTTNVGAATGEAGEIDAQELQRMLDCGINEPSLDKLTPQDSRFPAMVWSWAAGEPEQSPTLNCALHNPKGHFVAADCDRVLPIACYNPDTRKWFISKQGGQWSEGRRICQQESQDQAAFAVPFNSHNNAKLIAAKKAGNYTTVWLDYSDRGRADGDWRPGKP